MIEISGKGFGRSGSPAIAGDLQRTWRIARRRQSSLLCDMTGLILIFLGPVAILIAAVVVMLLWRFELLPDGVSTSLAGCLIFSMTMGGMFVVTTVGEFIVRPAQLQNELLGREYGTVLSLRSYEHWGFQDQGWVWRYRLSPRDTATLASRCRPYVGPVPAPPGCLLNAVGSADPNEDGGSRNAALEGNILVLEEYM